MTHSDVRCHGSRRQSATDEGRRPIRRHTRGAERCRSHGRRCGDCPAAGNRRTLRPLFSAGRFSAGTPWGRSSAGRASRSQCEGREFDPPRLHHFICKAPSPRGFLFSRVSSEAPCTNVCFRGPALRAPSHLIHRPSGDYLRVAVPDALRALVGRTEVVRPLGGGTRRLALRRAAVASSRVLAVFDRLLLHPMTAPDAARVRAVIDQHLRDSLAEFDTLSKERVSIGNAHHPRV